MTDLRGLLRGFWKYYGSYFQTRLHAATGILLTVFIGLVFLHPVFFLVGVVVYLAPPVYLFHKEGVPDDDPGITVDCVPTTVVDGSREPDTAAMRNSEVRFTDGEATLHSSVQIPQSCSSFQLRFSTPTHVARAELNGPPEPEHTYNPMENTLACENITVYGFDPIIRLYETDEGALTSPGDYYLRIFDDDDDTVLSEVRLVSR